MRKARGVGREDKWRGAVEDKEGICWGENEGLMGGELNGKGAEAEGSWRGEKRSWKEAGRELKGRK